MTESSTTGCAGCDALRLQVQQLLERVAALEAELSKARKHSGNSSKPPSSDIVKAPKPKHRGSKRKQGGQPGHSRHERTAFSPEQVDQSWDYSLTECPDCGGHLQDSDTAPRVLQQVEIIERPIHVEEHRGLAHWCASCEKLHYAPLPVEVVQTGLVGPRLTALVGYLKGACHASYSTIQRFLRDVAGVSISRGQLAKLVQKVSQSLAVGYEGLLAILPDEARLNIDETGHPDRGARHWTWCFRAANFTLFRIDPSRGSGVLLEVLGAEFNGLLGCDYFSAYRKYMRLNEHVNVQFCLAHFIRDVKFLVEHAHADNRRYGNLLLGHLKKLFGIIHRRDEFVSDASFRRSLAAVRNTLSADAILQLPATREASNLANRFIDHYESYFRFITEPDIEPTNNLAEQAIRFVALHRRVTQGTRGNNGQRWCERIWTAFTTCLQQGRSVFNFLCQSVRAHLQQAPPPQLLTQAN